MLSLGSSPIAVDRGREIASYIVSVYPNAQVNCSAEDDDQREKLSSLEWRKWMKVCELLPVLTQTIRAQVPEIS